MGEPTPTQAGAIKSITCARASCFMTGGPGTGKTWTTRRVVDLLLEAGFAVVVVSPLRKALALFEGLDHPGVVVSTVHGFVCDNEPERSGDRPRKRFVDRVTTGHSLANPKAANGLVVGVVIEVMSCSKVMFDLFVNSLKAMKCGNFSRIICEGDVFQLAPVTGSPVYGSALFTGKSMLLVALWESKRHEGLANAALRAVIENLRDIRYPIRAESKNWLRMVAATRHKPADVTLTFTNANAARHRHAHIKRRQGALGVKILTVDPVIPAKKRKRGAAPPAPPPAAFELGGPVMITVNIEGVVEDGAGRPEGPLLVANGTTAVLHRWPRQNEPGFDCVEADDDVVTYVVVRLDTGGLVRIAPVEMDGVLHLPMVHGCACTIHKAQGVTLPASKTLAIDVAGTPSDRLVSTLLVALSRVQADSQIAAIRGLDVDALDHAACGDATRKRFQKAVLKQEDRERRAAGR